jgi:hypothetical protein
MDVVFLKSNELNWEENYERARSVINQDIKLVDGKKATSIKNAYEIMLSNISTDYFMMIEGDNYVLDNCVLYLDLQKPIKFWTTNKYDVQYEHGGVKIMNKESCAKELKINNHIYNNFEVSANLFLTSIPEVISEHRFDWSPKNEWTSIAKELIKLHYWGHFDYVRRWTASEYPKKVYDDVLELTKRVGFTELFETLLPSLGKIYDESIKE